MIRSVELIVEEAAGIDRYRSPVTQGVPFPDGELPAGTAVCVVDSTGTALPTQTRCLASWDPDRKYVKWLLVDFQITLKAGERKTLSLKYGADVTPALHQTPITIEHSDRTLTLDTGALSLSLHEGKADFFGALTVSGNASGDRTESKKAGQAPLREFPGPFLYMKSVNGSRYDSRCGLPAPSIEIEEDGPVRASLCIRGYHADADGRRFCPYIIRLHAYAGSSDIRIFHTWIFDQEPDLVKISEIGIRLPFDMGPNRRAAFGGDGRTHRVEAFNDAGIYQISDCEYKFLADGRQLGTGRRAAGWCSCGGNSNARSGGLAVALRDCWQEYPKGFRITPDGLDILLWPENADPLDYANPYKEEPISFSGIKRLDERELLARLEERPAAPLNLKSIGLGHIDYGMTDAEAGELVRRFLAKHAAERTYCFCDTGTDKAYGSAKTHELWLRFSDAAVSDADAQSLALAANEPVLALPDPAYVCGTGAARLAAPKQNGESARFADIEKALETLFDALALEPRDVCGIYGAINFGELINGHTKANQIVYRNYRENPSGWNDIVATLGTFNNEAQDLIYQLWIYYLRTGERKYFKFAEAKSEHTADVDFIHAHPTDPDKTGLMHYHNVLNWSGGVSPSHSLISGFMLHYYLTGNRRVLEVALSTADNFVRNQTPSGVVSGEGLSREITGPLMGLLEAYQVTWEKKYRDVISATLSMLRQTLTPHGAIPVGLYTGQGEAGREVWAEGLNNRTDYPGGMVFHMLYDSYRLFQDNWIKDWIITLADSWLYDVRCDDYIPASRLNPEKGKPSESIRVNKISDDWYWRSFLDYSNNYFDPVVAFAYTLTRDQKYLGYLYHRASIFPERASEAYRLLTCETFNAINHWGDAIPAVINALEAVDPDIIEQETVKWKKERIRAGFPVYEGNRDGFDKEGIPRGTAMNIYMQAYGAREAGRTRIIPPPEK